MKPSKLTRGTLELRRSVERMRKRGVSQNEVARSVGCLSGNFSKLLAGDKEPGRSLALRISQVLKIPISSWDEPAGDEAAA